MTFDYTIKLIQERIDFLSKRIIYAKHSNDDLLEKKAKEKKAELEKAIQILHPA